MLDNIWKHLCSFNDFPRSDQKHVQHEAVHRHRRGQPAFEKSPQGCWWAGSRSWSGFVSAALPFPFPSLLSFVFFLYPNPIPNGRIWKGKPSETYIPPSWSVDPPLGQSPNQFWAIVLQSSTAGSSPVYQLCEAGLWGVLYADQKICRRHHSTGAWEQVRWRGIDMKSKKVGRLQMRWFCWWLWWVIFISRTKLLMFRIAIELISQHIADRLSGQAQQAQAERDSSYSPQPQESRRR